MCVSWLFYDTMKQQKKSIQSLICLLITGSLLITGNVFADDNEGVQCTRPEKTPSVPDGRRSSEQEMKEALTEVREYLNANATFRECIGTLLEASKDSSSDNLRKAAERLITETMETDELLGELFNQQVRIYKSINPSY